MSAVLCPNPMWPRSPVVRPGPNWGDSCSSCGGTGELASCWGHCRRRLPPPGARGGGLGEEEAGGAGGGAGGGGGGGAGEGGGSCTWLQHSAASSTGPYINHHNQGTGPRFSLTIYVSNPGYLSMWAKNCDTLSLIQNSHLVLRQLKRPNAALVFGITLIHLNIFFSWHVVL